MNDRTVGTYGLVDESQLFPKPDRPATGNSLELDTQLLDYERICKCEYSFLNAGEAEGRMDRLFGISEEQEDEQSSIQCRMMLS
jgi:hypothetical protein